MICLCSVFSRRSIVDLRLNIGGSLQVLAWCFSWRSRIVPGFACMTGSALSKSSSGRRARLQWAFVRHVGWAFYQEY